MSHAIKSAEPVKENPGRFRLGSVVMGGFFGLFAVFGSMGMGDTKLAGVFGALLGFVSWPAAVLAGRLSTTLIGVGSVGLLGRHLGRKHTMAYGPALVVGTLLAIEIQTAIFFVDAALTTSRALCFPACPGPLCSFVGWAVGGTTLPRSLRRLPLGVAILRSVKDR